ncbi:MAG: transcription elongation factor GreA [Chromatiales bacterium]|jgi:transcription elongation factor GreA|nr:transcription elongation factor GreA [Chromatiales bacterium]
MARAPMTLKGSEKLKEELKKLKGVDRPSVIKAIAEARAHGDLKENAEYHAAREQQSFLEGRIAEIDDALARAQVIDPATVNAGGRVVFGAHVALFNLDTQEEATYQIVGELEADISQQKISVTSPIARALIGKNVGDEATVEAPAGMTTYEIADVSYG